MPLLGGTPHDCEESGTPFVGRYEGGAAKRDGTARSFVVSGVYKPRYTEEDAHGPSRGIIAVDGDRRQGTNAAESAQARVLALWSYGMVLTQSCACHTIAVFLGLVLTVLLGAWAATTAATTGRLRWLLACAALVGLGFNIKMLEAYLVIPAFGLVYLWSAPGRLRRRIGHLALATVALLTASLSWAVAVDLTPASLRPYVGSSGTNSELNLALGYNGLSRLLGGSGTPGCDLDVECL